MTPQLTISKAKPAEPSLDQGQLYDIGLKHVRELAGRIWTDHNTHDPGITTLELLCYALTDLTYRASFPLEDLLAGGDEALFFTPRQILPNRPLTELDYRKLVIDLPGVKNAWIKETQRVFYADTVKGELLREKPDLNGVRDVAVRGLYKVAFEYTDEVTAEAQKEEIRRDIMRRLQANRNLCEDFIVDEEGVGRQDFNLCAELTLADDADVSRVKAEILFQVERYLAPPVKMYSLSEMLERVHEDGSRFTVPEIFDGPALDCGFIDDKELQEADLRKEILLSDIISILMDIDGVRAVRDIVVNPTGSEAPPDDKWRLRVDDNKQPALNKKYSRLVFYKRSMPVPAQAEKVDARYDELVLAERGKLETPQAYDLPIPGGRRRGADRYYSFQNHFPALYGIGEQGLPSGASPEREAQAYQLKAYLLFFDQVMANYFAQLAHVRDLFSTDPELQQTYFCQVVESFAGFEKIYDKTAVARALESEDERVIQIDRRNRFLDHLVARFAERFHEYVSVVHASFGASPESLIKVKCDFLRSYPVIGTDRGLAYNQALKDPSALWDTSNISGLEKRLAKLLGIANDTRRNLSSIPADIYGEVDASPGDEFRFRVLHRVTGKILLSSSTRYKLRERAREEMIQSIHAAQRPAGYQRKVTSSGEHYFNVVNDEGEVIARRIEYFDTEARMNAAIDELMEYLKEHYSDEGMYLIENILLLPEEEGDPLLPICVDPKCAGCADMDPYSYRVQVILPAYAGRFQSMDFRRFAEGVIRREMPAHILPKVCWIDRTDMGMVEAAYHAFLRVRSGASSAGRRQKLEALRDALYAVKNVYPVEKLAACDSGEETPKFIVGQTALGSLKTGKSG